MFKVEVDIPFIDRGHQLSTYYGRYLNLNKISCTFTSFHSNFEGVPNVHLFIFKMLPETFLKCLPLNQITNQLFRHAEMN